MLTSGDGNVLPLIEQASLVDSYLLSNPTSINENEKKLSGENYDIKG
jgi:hypothetical protein